MILEDLLIYGDWLEENDIKNDLYKKFLNKLRIKLRRNNAYGWDDGNEIQDEYGIRNIISEDGNGYGDGVDYINGFNWAISSNGFLFEHNFFEKFDGNGLGFGYHLGSFYGNGIGHVYINGDGIGFDCRLSVSGGNGWSL